MQQTLLEMTQNILSRLDGDEVNSHSETSESRQVASIIRNTYYNIFSRANLPEHQQHFQLTPSTDMTKPVLMTRPSNVSRIDWIKYDMSLNGISNPSFSYVTIYPIQQYMDTIHSYDIDETNVLSFTLDGIEYLYKNNGHPTFCMVYKDNYVIFNSYNVVQEATLQSINTLCFGQVIPTFEMSDTFVPNLDEKNSMLLLEESTAIAFAEMKQTVNEKAERNARRGWTSLQKSKSLAPMTSFDELPYFGRR